MNRRDSVKGTGLSVLNAIFGTIPEPTHNLRWGEDIPAEVMAALRNGETALLHDADGQPYSIVLMDYFGTIREQRVNTGGEPCPKGCGTEQRQERGRE